MRFRLMFLLLTMAMALTAGESKNQEHIAAFELLKSLEGTWMGTNADGQKISFRYEVIGNGTALLEQTTHHGHGKSHKQMKMATLYTLDGDQLKLTHYCVAGNQPNMRAIRIDDSEIEFAFVNATGMANENEGHMHHAVFRIEGTDTFSTVWTYHKDGKPTFKADINAKRIKNDDGT